MKDNMNMNTKKVLACVDGSASTTSVTDWAIWSALRLEVPLEFLHVVDRHAERGPSRDLSGNLGMDAQESLMQELTALDEQRSKLAMDHGRHFLDQVRARATTAGLEKIDTRQRHGALLDTLHEMEPQIRLAILGPHVHDRSSSRLHLDHHVENVVRSLQVPVLAANGPCKMPHSFVLAFDGSATGRKTVQTVAASPLLRGMICHIVTAGSPTSQVVAQAEEAREVLSETGFVCEVAITEGHAEEVLHAYQAQHKTDLLVMGAYGHSRIRELILGSITTTMLRSSPTPVLILR